MHGNSEKFRRAERAEKIFGGVLLYFTKITQKSPQILNNSGAPENLEIQVMIEKNLFDREKSF